MSRDKELGEVVSAIISLVNNHYSFLVELLCVLTVMLRERGLQRSDCYCLWAMTPNCKIGGREAGAHHLVSGYDHIVI